MGTHIDVDTAQSCLRLRGDLSDAAGAELYAAAQTVSAQRPAEVVVDLAAVPCMDSLGGAWLSRTAEALRQAGVALHLAGARGQVAEFVALIRATLETPPPPPLRRPGVFEGLGDAVFTGLEGIRAAHALIVDMLYWAILAPLTGKGLRWHSLVEELASIGVRATLIVCLMNFLLGLVIALMSSAPLRQFGAGIYVAPEVGAAGSTGRGEANLFNLTSFLIVEQMRRGMHPKDAGLEGLKRIKANTIEKRLLNGRGLPAFNIRFFVLNAKGEHAGVSMYAAQETTYAVCDENGPVEKPLEGLLSGSPTD